MGGEHPKFTPPASLIVVCLRLRTRWSSCIALSLEQLQNRIGMAIACKADITAS